MNKNKNIDELDFMYQLYGKGLVKIGPIDDNQF
jgi:hypothetical protein